jgi:hypothetical protein
MAVITNFYIDTGWTFGAVIRDKGSDGLTSNLTGYSVTSYIRKSYASSTHIDFNATIFSITAGQVRVSLTDEQTTDIKPGRYMYDIEIQNSTGERLRISEGIIIFTPQITKPDPT